MDQRGGERQRTDKGALQGLNGLSAHLEKGGTFLSLVLRALWELRSMEGLEM